MWDDVKEYKNDKGHFCLFKKMKNFKKKKKEKNVFCSYETESFA